MGPPPPGALSVAGWSATVGSSQSKIIDLLVSAAVNVVAVTGVVMLFALESLPVRVIGGVLLGLATVAVAWLLKREAARLGPLLTAYAGSRLVLLVGVAAAYLARRPDQMTWLWVATGLALLAVLTEPTIKVLLSKTEQVAVNLPGVRPVPAPPFRPDRIAVGSLVVVVVGGVLAATAAPAWLYLSVVLLGFAAVLIIIGYALRANLISKASLSALPKALARFKPAFVVYYGGEHGARYQLGQWLPYLERLGKPFVVITREAATVPTITALTKAPVVVPRTNSALGNLDALVVKSMKAAFYVQGSRANLSLQRHRRLTHVWLNHGDSDKAANFSARHATYDKVLVSGQQGVERYAAHGVSIPPDRLLVVGRPQIEKIGVRDAPLPSGAPRTVLYAPTWRGGRPATDYSSLPIGERIVGALLERGTTVIFRPHPLSYADPIDVGLIRRIQQRLAADRRASGREHVWGERAERDWEVADCLNASDGLVTDVSSVASDNLASGKPFAMVAMRSSGEAFLAEFPMARVAYVIEKDLSTLDAALDGLHGPDPLASARRAYRRHCLGDQLGVHAADEFLRVAGDVVTGRKISAGAATSTRRTPGDELTEVLGARPELDDLLAVEAVASPERAEGRPGNVA
ncbi:MAG TPA: CDP-glycerol glycerophosphotransferase family protein [Microlunatus sp.]|nr:CDP-glycerol glycerophosphotransferase family protein [Microlunatus sp.]